jgi:hypothetical protein
MLVSGDPQLNIVTAYCVTIELADLLYNRFLYTAAGFNTRSTAR